MTACRRRGQACRRVFAAVVCRVSVEADAGLLQRAAEGARVGEDHPPPAGGAGRGHVVGAVVDEEAPAKAPTPEKIASAWPAKGQVTERARGCESESESEKTRGSVHESGGRERARE